MMGPRKKMRKAANVLLCLTIPPEEHNKTKSVNGIQEPYQFLEQRIIRQSHSFFYFFVKKENFDYKILGKKG